MKEAKEDGKEHKKGLDIEEVETSLQSRDAQESAVLASENKESKISTIIEAKTLVEEMKKQNKILTEQLKKAERISTETILSGRSPAGVEVTQEEKEIQAARNILKGTGYEDTLFPRRR